MRTLISSFFIFIFIWACAPSTPKVLPVGPVPNTYQQQWQELEYYGFIHFNMNTFTNKEWGYGDEQPEQFNPTALDAQQWARIAKEAGMKGLIITAKHHDGFCLWPSAYTEHSVKNSPWRNGKGDLIKELSEACAAYGLKFGVYLSPWDRNHPDYGTPEYITYYRNQLKELLSNYGPIFEVWFDGANGGDGYYGGANEERRVDKKTYYDWPNTIQLVRELQPQAMIFSDAGPDIRWVGNERGYAYDTTWSPFLRNEVFAGMPNFDAYAQGTPDGTHWVPTESDVSIRPGWYYHPEQDEEVKSLEALVSIYFNSVGRNSSLLLNIPVDTRGRIHENDEAQLLELAAYLKEMYQKDYAIDAAISAPMGASSWLENLNDADNSTFWAASTPSTTLLLEWDSGQEINTLMVQEHLPGGQRIQSFELEGKTATGWHSIASGGTIGNKRLIRFETDIYTSLKLTIKESKAAPVLSSISVYKAP
jgi:alpha-L-fucosidase